MKILSLNAWHGTREQELRNFLAEHVDSTDVFCFQEADGERIERIFQDVFPTEAFQKAGSTKTSGKKPDAVMTFVRQGIDIVSTAILLSDTADDAGYSYVTHLKVGALDVAIANTHGVPYPGDKLDTPGRIMQSKVIIDELEKYEGSKIACGDFNLDPSAESVHMFERAGYTNLIDAYAIATTRNELAWQRYPDNIQLFADYAFVSPGVSVRGFEVPNNQVSDHLPLIIEIEDATEPGITLEDTAYAGLSAAEV